MNKYLNIKKKKLDYVNKRKKKFFFKAKTL